MVLQTLLYLLLAAISIATQLSHACPSKCRCHKTSFIYHVNCSNQSLTSLPMEIANESGNYITDISNLNNSDYNNIFQNISEVIDLDLSFNQLREINHQELSQLPNLRYLNLQYNSIKTIHSKSFASSIDLRALNLAYNQLETLGSAVFIGLHHLEMLDLHGNIIDNISDNAFLHTDSLISLDLSHNGIRELPVSLFENLNKLEILDLSHNNLDTANNVLVDGLKKIKTVNFSHNQIESFSCENLPKIEDLDLSWNKISIIGKTDFLNISNVKLLKLHGNPVKNLTEAVFRHLVSLEILSLSFMPKLYYLSVRAFEGLQNLKLLNLSHNSHLSFIHQNLFLPLRSLENLDLSFNNITRLWNSTALTQQIISLDLQGNSFICDCAIEWLVNEVQRNDSIIVNKNDMNCLVPNSTDSVFLNSLDVNELYCHRPKITNFSQPTTAKLGQPVMFFCETENDAISEIVWMTPRRKVLKYNDYHPYSIHSQNEQITDPVSQAEFEETRQWYGQIQAYYTEFQSYTDRITILQDGSLYIHFVLRSDAGPYTCVVQTPRNSISEVIQFTLDYQAVNEVKIWSIIVGSICAASFFLLNLTVSLISAGVRKCISQRRRDQICQILESMDQYKTAHLTRIKENYNNQVGRIRDQYHYQLGRMREHHHNKMGRIREGASQKVERMRENYNTQLGKLKDYSSNQLVQIREKYNNQILRIKDYGNGKFERLHEKYKLKQQHMMRLLEMMNLDSCKTVFESECVRTESMILQSDILGADVPDVPLHSPLDSESISDSEYVTATNSEAPSHENLYVLSQIADIPYSIPRNFTCDSLDGAIGKNYEPVKETEYLEVNETDSDQDTAINTEPTITSSFHQATEQTQELHDIVTIENQPTRVERPPYNLMVLDPLTLSLDTSFSIGSVKESSV